MDDKKDIKIMVIGGHGISRKLRSTIATHALLVAAAEISSREIESFGSMVDMYPTKPSTNYLSGKRNNTRIVSRKHNLHRQRGR